MALGSNRRTLSPSSLGRPGKLGGDSVQVLIKGQHCSSVQASYAGCWREVRSRGRQVQASYAGSWREDRSRCRQHKRVEAPTPGGLQLPRELSTPCPSPSLLGQALHIRAL